MAMARMRCWPTFSINIACTGMLWAAVSWGSLGGGVSGTEWGILKSLSGSGSKCVHIQGDSLANNAPLELIQCSLGSPGQHFDVSGWGDYWEVGGPLVFRSGRCVTGDSRPPPPVNGGRNATAWDCLGEPHQSWTIGGTDQGSASPFQLLGSNGKCLTAEADADPGYFDEWGCGDQATNPHQWFIMERVPTTVALNSVKFQTDCVHIKGDSQSNGAQLEPATCAVTINQLFSVPELSQYVTTPGPLQLLSGKCLTGSATSTADGVNMTVSDCVEAPHQKWKIAGGVPFSSSFQVVASNGKCLTVEKEGAYIDQYECGPQANNLHQWFTTLQPNRVGLLGSVAWDGLCVHIKGDSLANWAGLEMIPCDRTSVAQQFDVTDWGSYKSSPGRLQFLSGRCISGDYSGSTENGVPTAMWNCEDQPQQLFFMRSGSLYETNSFQLASSNNGMCLTPTPADRGASFVQWECGDFASFPHQFFNVDSRGVVPPAAASQPPPPPPVPECLPAQATCNPDDVQCCDGEYCETLFSSSWCRTCIPVGNPCGSYFLTPQCCQYASCRVDADGQYTCQWGDCEHEVGAECIETPCCAGLVCSPWLGRFVCRPNPPQCYKDGGGDCGLCCSGRCTSSTLITDTEGLNYAQSAAAGFIGGGCECASSVQYCLDDSYCCSGKCGIDYKCVG